MPVFVDDGLIGVTAVDLSLSDLLSEAIHFRRSKSYAFVIDTSGSVMSHQLLTESSNETSAARNDVKIESIESSPQLRDVFDKMKAQESGEVRLFSRMA